MGSYGARPFNVSKITPNGGAGRAGTETAWLELVQSADLDPAESFDSILYIDVLEHIKDDRTELEMASRHLEPNGHLIVLAPAHQSLFTPFDSAIGHFRRYSLPGLAALSPLGTRMILSRYLDCIGLFASLGNRLLLHSSSPTLKQIKFWDSLLVLNLGESGSFLELQTRQIRYRGLAENLRQLSEYEVGVARSPASRRIPNEAY